jgi:hypothetical protein
MKLMECIMKLGEVRTMCSLFLIVFSIALIATSVLASDKRTDPCEELYDIYTHSCDDYVTDTMIHSTRDYYNFLLPIVNEASFKNACIDSINTSTVLKYDYFKKRVCLAKKLKNNIGYSTKLATVKSGILNTKFGVLSCKLTQTDEGGEKPISLTLNGKSIYDLGTGYACEIGIYYVAPSESCYFITQAVGARYEQTTLLIVRSSGIYLGEGIYDLRSSKLKRIKDGFKMIYALKYGEDEIITYSNLNLTTYSDFNHRGAATKPAKKLSLLKIH